METKAKIRRAENKGVSVFHMLEYRQSSSPAEGQGAFSKRAISVILLYLKHSEVQIFFSLYVTQRLGLSKAYLALFPILNAAVMLIFMVGIHRIGAAKFRVPLWVGLGAVL